MEAIAKLHADRMEDLTDATDLTDIGVGSETVFTLFLIYLMPEESLGPTELHARGHVHLAGIQLVYAIM